MALRGRDEHHVMQLSQFEIKPIDTATGPSEAVTYSWAATKTYKGKYSDQALVLVPCTRQCCGFLRCQHPAPSQLSLPARLPAACLRAAIQHFSNFISPGSARAGEEPRDEPAPPAVLAPFPPIQPFVQPQLHPAAQPPAAPANIAALTGSFNAACGMLHALIAAHAPASLQPRDP